MPTLTSLILTRPFSKKFWPEISSSMKARGRTSVRKLETLSAACFVLTRSSVRLAKKHWVIHGLTTAKASKIGLRRKGQIKVWQLTKSGLGLNKLPSVFLSQSSPTLTSAFWSLFLTLAIRASARLKMLKLSSRPWLFLSSISFASFENLFCNFCSKALT